MISAVCNHEDSYISVILFVMYRNNHIEAQNCVLCFASIIIIISWRELDLMLTKWNISLISSILFS